VLLFLEHSIILCLESKKETRSRLALSLKRKRSPRPRNCKSRLEKREPQKRRDSLKSRKRTELQMQSRCSKLRGSLMSSSRRLNSIDRGERSRSS